MQQRLSPNKRRTSGWDSANPNCVNYHYLLIHNTDKENDRVSVISTIYRYLNALSFWVLHTVKTMEKIKIFFFCKLSLAWLNVFQRNVLIIYMRTDLFQLFSILYWIAKLIVFKTLS